MEQKMTIQEKLQIIQKISGLPQTDLAHKLGVTFVAYNRWVRGRANPRHNAAERIESLYQQLLGGTKAPQELYVALSKAVAEKQRVCASPLGEIVKREDVRNEFLLSLTYHSNSIEGSTLTEQDTADVLFRNIALPDKTLIEQLEAKNHQTALEYVLRAVVNMESLDEHFILKTHGMLMNGIRPDAGAYRSHAVRIAGSYVPTANYAKVSELMKTLVNDINAKSDDAIAHVASIHARFEQIHPFSDGNGRVGRLLMQAMLLRSNLAPAIIRQEKKQVYYRALQGAQVDDKPEPLQEFIASAVLDGYLVLESER